MDIMKTFSELTLQEKATLLAGQDSWYTAGVDRLGVKRILMTDGPSGLRKQLLSSVASKFNDSIPEITFPCAALMASSMDSSLLFTIGDYIGEEAKDEQVGIVMGPGINIKRSPLCGRNFEYYSEDPLVSGVLATSFIKGIQSHHVGVSLKHFAANNRENKRLTVSSDIKERALREIYLRGFEYVIKHCNPLTVMVSYNRINGVLNSQNQYLLTDILRHEWDYKGAVVSDRGAVFDHIKAIAAGTDMQKPGKGQASVEEVVNAVRTGKLDQSIVNRAAYRMLKTIIFAQPDDHPKQYNRQRHHELARKVADEGIILLKNNNHELPINNRDSIAVIGALAERPRYQGGGSSEVVPFRLISPLDALKEKEFDTIKYKYEPGYDITTNKPNDDLEKNAISIAESAAKVIMFVGYPESSESEGKDKVSISLPDNQLHLMKEICAVNSHIVVVLQNGSAVEMPWINDVKAVVETYLAGEAVGEATWDILTGRINPSGHLVESFPVKLVDNPSYLTFDRDNDHEEYAEGIFVGYRFYDSLKKEVLFPFGHGLSYTTFNYRNLHIDVEDEKVAVSFDVLNTGTRPGKIVPQLYIANQTDKHVMPIHELRGFTKVNLNVNESKRIEFNLVRRDFSWYSEHKKCWQADSGQYVIEIGNSSRDLRLTKEISMTFKNEVAKINMETYIDEVLASSQLKGMFIKMLKNSYAATSKINTPFPISEKGEVLNLDVSMITNQPLRALVENGIPEQSVQKFIYDANQCVTEQRKEDDDLKKY
ncbi:MAG: glycoside hydrolase family 3 C-terminal domain-containing protein [Sporolactobacillus sp.]|jgi:beta-glucosidase|nr:glycoside hydrolase family 3 C-terminal domain-containing protein [Sporolactobacillus sp.]